MYSKKTKKDLRQQFNAYAANIRDHDDEAQMFYTSSHVVFVKHGGQGLRIQMSGYDEAQQSPQIQLNSARFESDPLWTPERAARKTTAKTLADFIAQTKKREEHAQKTAHKKQDSDLRLGNIRIVLG
ncbi:MAG: hypothetical protein Q8K65_10245 [Alphaproteobacteria bacterium]|nr:hypothetical protein [Alphaproteobacteria bacterium]